jgi:hypothetical protein
MMNTQTRFSHGVARFFILAAAVVAIGQAQAGMLVESVSEHYDKFRGVDYVRYTGRFEGATSKGAYRVPFEIVAPADPDKGNGTVVFEPPHFIYGTFARDVVLGNLLDPFVADAMIAGVPVIANMPAEGAVPFPRDVEILKQFAEALIADPTAVAALGKIDRRYAYGLSQSAEAMYELFYGPGAAGIFDLTVLHVPLWRPAFARSDVLAVLPETFTPLSDIGKVMIVSAEGDLLISQSMQLRNAASHPDYRLYEVAGAPHLALDVVVDGVRTNPLDLSPVVRAAFNNGHRWQMGNKLPPASTLLEAATPGEIDPVYWVSTGIARDANLNAAGGVRFPDVAIGRAFHFPSAPGVEVIPGLQGLIGFWFDLACIPAPEAMSFEPRFTNHGDYVRQVTHKAFALAQQGYILRSDMRELIRAAAGSDVGKPGTCSAAP